MSAPSSAPHLRVTSLVTAALLFTGVGFGATTPYQAIVAIEGLGISNADYALILTAGALIGAVSSVLLGWLSDRIGDRRLLVIATAAFSAIGPALLWVAREPWAFVVMTCVLMPVGGAAYSQTLAFARAYLAARGGTQIDFMMTLIRAVFALSWVIAPPLAGWLAAAYTVFDPYAMGALAGLACTLIFLLLLGLPETRITVAHEDAAVPAPSMRIPGFMLVGIVGVICASTAVRVNALATSLAIIVHWGGTVADVGIYSSLAALIEIPCMVAWGLATRRVPVPALLALGSALFGAYAFFAGRVTSVPELLWLQGLNGLATAALMSLPIAYVQEAIKGRVGLSTSLLDVIFVAAGLLSAGAFAIATTPTSYLAIFDIAAASGAAGAVIVAIAFVLGRRAPAR